MGQYTAITATAKALLAKFGQPMVLSVYINGTPIDPALPWRLPATAPQTYPFRGVMSGFGISRYTKPGEQARKLIMPGDVAQFASDVPNLTSTITTDVVYLISALDPIDPDGTPIIYLALCDRWPAKT